MLKKYFFFVVINLCIIQHGLTQVSPGKNQQKNYYTGTKFSDTGRIDKIRSTASVVDNIFKQHASKNHYPAIVYGIVADGKLIYTGNTGYTNLDKKIPANSNSVFRIASMTKSFTTLAILQLRDRGKLNLDDPIHKFIPGLKNVKYLTTDAPPVTIRNLMTHAAGFPEDNPWGDRQLADTDADLLKIFTDGVTFSNVPGISYEYSNLGFALLGRIITNVSGKPYQQYISENIFKPLGMSNTYWEYTKVDASKLAYGYRWVNEQWREEELLHDGSYGAMGGLLTSLEDFSKYMALHMNAWPPRNGAESSVLKRSSLREMHQIWNFGGFNSQFKLPNGRTCPIASGYGYGLGVVKDCDGKTWVGHSGGLPGFGSQWRFFPEYGIGVVSFANLTYAGTGLVNLTVLDTIITLAKLKPRQYEASEVLKQRQQQLIRILPDWNNAENSGIFADNFFKDYIIDSLKKDARTVFNNAGKIVRVHDLVPENNLRGTFILEGEKKNIEIYFTLTPEKQPLIQEYRIRERSK
jgi:CubicO group peptidase (beta-lactamase class C family)